MADIVERLHQLGDAGFPAATEGADDIARLRAELAQANDAVQRLTAGEKFEAVVAAHTIANAEVRYKAERDRLLQAAADSANNALRFMQERDAALALHKSCYADLDAALSRESAALALLRRCRPIVESEMALMDSMARHMAGEFDPKDVQSADNSADFYYMLLRDIDALLSGK